jgi:predicted RNA-binding Zn-ribbon protein involved in translation (DUF1610 family)
MSENKKARKPRKKKVEVQAEEVVQESVAPQTTQKQEEKAVRYKCSECGNVQGVKRCLRCGGHIVREV